MHYFSYINDHYEKDPKIPVNDLGLLRGFGVFDFMRTYNGRPFHLHLHLQRFRNSAKKLGLFLEKTDQDIEDIIQTLISKNQLQEANVRMILTGGQSIDHIFPGKTPTFIVMVFPQKHLPQKYYLEGISTITYPLTRFLPDCKSLNYIPAVLALQKAQKVGAFEAIYLDENRYLLEGTTSNFFACKNGSLITPNQGILPGVIREVVVHLAKKHNIPLEKRPIHYDELQECSEAFITASNKEVLPIVQIDDIRFSIGSHTKNIMQLFREYTQMQSWAPL